MCAIHFSISLGKVAMFYLCVSIFFSMMAILFLRMGPATECPPSVLAHGFAFLQIREGSKGVCPIGRRTHVREGEAGSAANVGRGKAKRFPLQGHLSPRGEPLPLRALRRSTPCHPSSL